MSGFIENIRARLAREKKATAEIDAGLAYLREHATVMSGDMKASAVRWLVSHLEAGRKDQIERFLLATMAYNTPDEDEVDEGDDSPIDDKKDKSKKKKAKSKADDEEAEEPRDTTPDRHEPHGARFPSEDDVLLMEIKSGYRGTPKSIANQVIFSGRLARGEVPPPPYISTGDHYHDKVHETAAAIIAAGKRRRGEIT